MSRELDARVAVEVMGKAVEMHARGFDGRSGWHDDVGFMDSRHPRSDWRNHVTVWPGEVPVLPEELYHYSRVPLYSSGIGPAWLVVEKMRGLGFAVEHKGPFHKDFGGRQWWEFMHPAEGWGGQAYRDLDSEAICEAALKAMASKRTDDQAEYWREMADEAQP